MTSINCQKLLNDHLLPVFDEVRVPHFMFKQQNEPIYTINSKFEGFLFNGYLLVYHEEL